MKRFFQIFFFVVFVTSVAALTVYVYLHHMEQPLKQVVIHVSRSTESGFIDKEEVMRSVEPYLADSVALKQINIELLEGIITSNPWVEQADVFTDINGSLIINIREVEPVLRIFPTNSSGFYLDKKGKIIPVNNKHTPLVMVANGYIHDKPAEGFDNINDTVYHNTVFKPLLVVTKTLNRYPFLKNMTGEIYINNQREFDLVPVVGEQIIKVGDTVNLQHRFENLIIFYKKAMVYEGWDKYKTLNIKFDNQIVCTK